MLYIWFHVVFMIILYILAISASTFIALANCTKYLRHNMTFIISILHYQPLCNMKSKNIYDKFCKTYSCKFLPYLHYSHNFFNFQMFLVAPFDIELMLFIMEKAETTTFCRIGNIKQLICCIFKIF